MVNPNHRGRIDRRWSHTLENFRYYVLYRDERLGAFIDPEEAERVLAEAKADWEKANENHS
jgi:hypothetical protein